VVTTPKASFAQAALDLAPLGREVAAAVTANRFRLARELRIGLLQVGEDQFGVQAGIGEDHGLQVVFQEFLGDARGLVDVAAPDAQGAIHDRRVVKDEGFLGRWRAVFGQYFQRVFDEARSQIARVRDGGRAADELGLASIKLRDAPQATQHVREMAAKNAAIGVEFVDDDVTQIFEKSSPARVVRKNAGVQHVRIAQDDVTFFADGFARVAGCVAIVGEDAETVVEALIQIVEFGELVLGEGFGGEEV